MAEVANTDLGLVELAKRTADGNLLEVSEVMAEENRIVEDAPWVPSNKDTVNVINRRMSLPSGSLTAINEGVTRESSKTKQIDEPIATLESLSRVDEKLTRWAPGNKQFVRFTEDMAFLEGLTQRLAELLIYGDRSDDPRSINGLATRFNDLSLDNVHDGGGTGSDVTSIYAVKWDIRKGVFLHFPKNSEGTQAGGVHYEDRGLRLVQDADGKEYFAWLTQWYIEFGLSIRDDNAVQRYANIESSGSSNIFDDDKLITLLRKFKNLKGVILYANSTVLTQMDINANNKTNVNYTVKDIWGIPTTHFRGVPVKQVDQIVDTETAVA